LIDYGVKKVCGAILGNVHEDFVCYSKLLEIKDVDVPVFLKKGGDVAEAKPAVVSDVKPNVVPDVKYPNVVADVKPDVVSDVKTDVRGPEDRSQRVLPMAETDVTHPDVSGNTPGNDQMEVPKENTIGYVVDVSGGNVDVPNPTAPIAETTVKNVVVQTGKKPVKVKGKAAAPPVAENSGETTIDNIGNQNPIVQANDEADETSSQGSKKGDQYKQKQRAEQKQKREENLAKGIEPESLLTKENLEQWICVEGRTYAYIAAYIVGCKEEEVSSLAKVYKIKKEGKNIAQKVLIGKKTRGG
jgi:hypothetical protein